MEASVQFRRPLLLLLLQIPKRDEEEQIFWRSSLRKQFLFCCIASSSSSSVLVISLSVVHFRKVVFLFLFSSRWSPHTHTQRDQLFSARCSFQQFRPLFICSFTVSSSSETRIHFCTREISSKRNEWIEEEEDAPCTNEDDYLSCTLKILYVALGKYRK